MMLPAGTLTFHARNALSTSLIPIWRAASWCGSSWACTAYFCAPSTCTCATPLTCEMRCAMRVSAHSSSVQAGSVVDRMTRYRIGWSAGFTLVNVGGVGMPCGSSRLACVIAPCTSTAAPSRLRSRLNSSVTCVEPSELTDVIDSSPAMVENWFSSGVATDAPIVSGLAPGSCAVTSSVGKSTFGRSLTGSERYATAPKSAMAAINRLVAIGRRMNPSEIFMIGASRRRGIGRRRGRRYSSRLHEAPEVGIDDRRQIQRDELRNEQAADDGEAQRLARLATGAEAECNRQRTEERRRCGHHDRPEADDAAFVNRIDRRLAVLPLLLEGEVDLHDRVFLDDADQHDQAHERVDVQLVAEQPQRHHGTEPRRWQPRENRDRMDVALVEHPEH